MKITKCKKCGADIAFLRLESGKLAPISISSEEKRYVVIPPRKKNGDLPFKTSAEALVMNTYLSHFADCPAAASFRKKED